MITSFSYYRLVAATHGFIDFDFVQDSTAA
jgi:hypothetical protein